MYKDVCLTGGPHMTVILVVIAIYMASMLFIGYRAKKSV